MPLRAVALLAAVIAVTPSGAAAEPQAPPARELRTPEGYLRVEEGEVVAGAGSLTTYRAAAVARAPVRAAVAAPAFAPPPPPPGSEPRASAGAEDPCRPERERYVARLLAMAGVDLERPLDLVEALTPGGDERLFWPLGLLAGVDPLRPLAWDTDLREAARRLGACHRAGG